MFIKFTPEGATAPLILADWFSGIDLEGDPEVDGQTGVDVEEFPEGDEVEIFGRGNHSKKFNFAATRQHKDEDAAQLFMDTHDEDVLGKGVLEKGGHFKTWRRVYKVAACLRARTRAEGVKTVTAYEFVHGLSERA